MASAVGAVLRHGASAGAAERPSVFAEDHGVGTFGVGKRQQLRKDVEFVLEHRIFFKTVKHFAEIISKYFKVHIFAFYDIFINLKAILLTFRSIDIQICRSTIRSLFRGSVFP